MTVALSAVRRARLLTAIVAPTAAALVLPGAAPTGVPGVGPAGAPTSLPSSPRELATATVVTLLAAAGDLAGAAGAALDGLAVRLVVGETSPDQDASPLPALALDAKLARESAPAQPDPAAAGVADPPREAASRSLARAASPRDRPAAMLLAIDVARDLGCRVTQNPAVGDPLHGSHVHGSKHYQRFPGTNVGRAIDVYCPARVMLRYFRWAESARRAIYLDDLFYDPAGYSYDAGEVWDVVIGGHADHVHLSI